MRFTSCGEINTDRVSININSVHFPSCLLRIFNLLEVDETEAAGSLRRSVLDNLNFVEAAEPAKDSF